MLTERQQQIWDYLVEYVDGHGYPPTVREIGEQRRAGLAVDRARAPGEPGARRLAAARPDQAARTRADRSRAPRAGRGVGAFTGSADDTGSGDVVRLPLLGEIAAGGPLLAEQNIEDYVAMPSRAKGDFLLRVKGESMIDAGILDGDMVIVQRAQDARNGEIVVALAGDDESTDEATVKTFYRDPDGRVRLQPENSALEPIYAKPRPDPRPRRRSLSGALSSEPPS